MMSRPSQIVGFMAVGVSLALGLYACSPNSSTPTAQQSGDKPLKVTLVSYAVTRVPIKKSFPNSLNNGKPKQVKRLSFSRVMGVLVRKLGQS